MGKTQYKIPAVYQVMWLLITTVISKHYTFRKELLSYTLQYKQSKINRDKKRQENPSSITNKEQIER